MLKITILIINLTFWGRTREWQFRRQTWYVQVATTENKVSTPRLNWGWCVDRGWYVARKWIATYIFHHDIVHHFALLSSYLISIRASECILLLACLRSTRQLLNGIAPISISPTFSLTRQSREFRRRLSRIRTCIDSDSEWKRLVLFLTFRDLRTCLLFAEDFRRQVSCTFFTFVWSSVWLQ